MAAEKMSSWPEMKEKYAKDVEPRRRSVVVDSAVPEFLPEPDVAPVVREKRKQVSLPEVTHSQSGKRKVRQTVGVRKQRDLEVSDEMLKLDIGKRTDETRRQNKLKQKRVLKIPREPRSDWEVTSSELSSDSSFEHQELHETEKPEFQLSSADLLRLGGLAAVRAEDLFPEMYGKNGVDSEERANIETRLSRFQEPKFLQIKNTEGKIVEEIIQDYINTIATFLDEHGDEVKNLKVVLGYTNPEKFLAGYIQFLVRWYPKMYTNSDDYRYASHDRLLDKLRDGLSKAFENSISHYFEVDDESEEITKRKNEIQFLIYRLERDMNQIIVQLPAVDELEHAKAS
jgi:hypothetical protein